MNEQLIAGDDVVVDATRQLEEIKEEFRKKRTELRKSQDAHGVVETIHGGFTFRLGNEIEDFDKAFGLLPA